MGEVIFPAPSDAIQKDPYYYHKLYFGPGDRARIYFHGGADAVPGDLPLRRLRQIASDVDFIIDAVRRRPDNTDLKNEAAHLYGCLFQDCGVVYGFYLSTSPLNLTKVNPEQFQRREFISGCEALVLDRMTARISELPRRPSAKAMIEIGQIVLRDLSRAWDEAYRAGDPAPWDRALGRRSDL